MGNSGSSGNHNRRRNSSPNPNPGPSPIPNQNPIPNPNPNHQAEIPTNRYVFAAATPYPNPNSPPFYQYSGFYPPPPPPIGTLPAPFDHHHRNGVHQPGWTNAEPNVNGGRYQCAGSHKQPAAYVEHQKAVTIKNDVNLKKETMKVVPDELDLGKFLVAFSFDAMVAGSLQGSFMCLLHWSCPLGSCSLLGPVVIEAKKEEEKEKEKEKGNGNNGKGNDKDKGKDKDKGNNGKGKGNGGKGNGKGKGNDKSSSTDYVMLDRNPATGQERFFCLAKGRCHYKTIECPSECSQRKPKKNKFNKGCFADCSSRCETTCKYRKANCNGFGSICYDPRFIGGDGTMFYFHGAKGGDFALVSDTDLHINAHFIGFRPQGRTRDFTWVQALALMFDSHTLVIAARKVSTWDDSVDSLVLRYDGKDVTIPTDNDAEWRPVDTEREVVIERTDEYNSVRVVISGLVDLDVKVTPISEEEDRAHGYRLPKGDAFAHLETQFKFKGFSENVEGVLGKTYQPDYVSPVKKGVAMPMMGGEDRYRTLGFLSTSCGSCRFQASGVKMVDEGANGDVLVQY